MIATHFAAKGCQVSVAARDQVALSELRETIRAKGWIINTVSTDVGDIGQVHKVFEAHHSQFGSNPEVVVNAAGVQGPMGPAWTLEPAEWEAAIRINLVGSYFVTKAAIESMLSIGYGTIIHFSGGGAAYARPNFSSYASSKTGVLRLVENIAEELTLAGYPRITINAIAPGAVKTRMTEQIIQAGVNAGAKAIQEAEQIWTTGGTPPELILALVDFLCDLGRNECISGRLIHVRDNYAEFVRKFVLGFPEEAGKLRRVPLA